MQFMDTQGRLWTGIANNGQAMGQPKYQVYVDTRTILLLDSVADCGKVQPMADFTHSRPSSEGVAMWVMQSDCETLEAHGIAKQGNH